MLTQKERFGNWAASSPRVTVCAARDAAEPKRRPVICSVAADSRVWVTLGGTDKDLKSCQRWNSCWSSLDLYLPGLARIKTNWTSLFFCFFLLLFEWVWGGEMEPTEVRNNGGKRSYRQVQLRLFPLKKDLLVWLIFKSYQNIQVSLHSYYIRDQYWHQTFINHSLVMWTDSNYLRLLLYIYI